jgi:hypothetical protein
MSQRLKGQEVSLTLIENGQALTTIADFRSCEITPKLEKKEEGYLGEKTDRYDEIFNGVDGRAELNYENEDVFALMSSVIDRATRRTPGTVVNIKMTLNFPNGDRPRILLSNVFFGAMPFAFGSRSDYGTFNLDFSCSNIQVIG